MGGASLPGECAGAVEEFEVEGSGGLSVYFATGASLHRHNWIMMEDEEKKYLS